MPPTGMKRPDQATLDAFAQWMEDAHRPQRPPHLPAPGLHRLNRTEYANAIRDLLALDVDATKFLPPDDSTRGFDNIAGALTMSPALLEAYLSASGKISRLALGTSTAPTQAVFDVPADTAQNHHIEGLPFGTRGGMLITHEFPADGQYSFTVKGVTGLLPGGARRRAGRAARGHGRRRAREAVRLGQGDLQHHRARQGHAARADQGGTAPRRRDVPGDQRHPRHRAEQAVPAHDEHAGLDPRVPVLPARRPGDHRGPVRGARRATDTASRRKIFMCRPAAAREEAACARTIVSTLAKRAFRRPVTAADQKLLLGFYQDGRERGRVVRRRHRGGAAAHPRRSGVHLSRRARARRTGRRQELSHHRPGAGVAPVVLPLEQHSGRRADRRGGAGPAAGAGGARAAGPPHAEGPARRGAGRQLHRPVAGRALAARPPSRW